MSFVLGLSLSALWRAEALPPSQVLDLMVKQALRTAGTGHTGRLYPATTHPEPHQGLNEWVMEDGWTAGFFPGFLWQLAHVTKDSKLAALAKNWTEGIRPHENDTSTHDVGFIVFDSFGLGYLLGGVQEYKSVVLQAAKSLATRFNSKVGATKSWNNGHCCRLTSNYTCNFPVIIDNMMNLELLLWSAANGGPSAHRDMAISHAEVTAAHHIRRDGSTYHVVDYDPNNGQVARNCTAQGYRDDSTWTRGQAWCLHGFSVVYQYTKLEKFKQAAVTCADYFLAHLPDDNVPLWDFQWTTQGLHYKDSSAGAVAGSGLAKLGVLLREEDPARATRYSSRAMAIVEALSSDYLGSFEATQGVVVHATTTGAYPPFAGANVDVSLPYGDFYLLELYRVLNLV